ncbi:MAG: glycosyltransferase, partial [Lachnospiraceae bacterium]|nr:glycosyltransferase [Lachnospiraceae bacterium]
TYASGEFVQFLDADDTLREDACEALYQKARETGADLIQFRHLFVRDDDSGLPMPSGKPPQEDLLFDLRDDAIRRQFLTGSHCTLGCTNKFYRMELLRKTGNHFPEHRIYEEPLFVYPLFLYADTILTIGEEYYHYFWHAGSIMTSKLGKRLLDHPCVQLELLEDLMARKELFERYRREIEVQFLFSFFCETIWFAKKNAGVLPIDFFHQMQQICRSVFPDWASNRTLCGMEAAGKVLPMLSMEIETEEELNRRIAEL